MKRLFAFATFLALFGGDLHLRAADKADKIDKDREAKQEGLKELNDFIGEWKGTGEPDKLKPAAKDLWSETITWGWRFKKEDVFLIMKVKSGKLFKSGELRFLPDKKLYEFTAVDLKDNKLVFEGELKEGILTLQREDAKAKEVQQVKMNTAADGVRFLYYYAHKPAGRTLFLKDYRVASNKAGESLGPTEKKNVCVVSGGLGTMTVSFGGETFYVCCSGCKDAFAENPEKYVKAFKAKQGKK